VPLSGARFRIRRYAGAAARSRKSPPFDELQRTLESGDSRLWTSIFSALGREQRWAESCHFLQTLRESRHKHLDTIVYNAVIKACERSSQWLQALQCLWELQMNKLQPDLVTFNTIISALQKGHRWQKALLMMDQVTSPDAVTCSAVVQACERGGRWDLALKYFLEARQQITLDVVSLNSVVSACGKWEQWQWALALLDEMRPDVVTYNATMDACARGQHWQKCLTLFNEMFHSILYPSIISYNTAIAACEHGPWDLALALLEDLQRQGLHARADTLSTAMSVCSKAQQAGVALQLLSKIPRHTPQRHLLIAYNTALNACARSQRWTWSLGLLEDMSRVDLSPDVVSFSSAVTACGKSQAWPMVLGLLEDLNTRSCAMNDYLCNAALRLPEAGVVQRGELVWTGGVLKAQHGGHQLGRQYHGQIPRPTEKKSGGLWLGDRQTSPVLKKNGIT
ncbi:Pentatricopeptide repeat-containing protein 10, partial [Durusdinium trenchii]